MTEERRLQREAVIDAAVALVEAEGEEGLGFNRVARALGIKPPSLYNHVENSADLRRRVALRGWQGYLALAEKSLQHTRTPHTRLRAVLVSYRAFATEHPALFAVMNSVPMPPEDPLFAPVANKLLGHFEQALSALEVPSKKRVHAVRALRSSVHGFVQLEQSGQFQMQADVEQSFQLLLDLLLQGVLALQPSAK